MAKYIFKRLLLSIPVLFGITLITFAIIHITPGGPTAIQSNMNAKVSADSVAKLRALYDLDKPVQVQYLKWLGRMARLDFGESFNDNRPALDKILEKIPNTLLLNILSLFLIFIIAVPIGVYSAVKQNSVFDKIFSVSTLIGYSMPTFWLALLLMMYFGVYLHILPVSGMRSQDAGRFPLLQKFNVMIDRIDLMYRHAPLDAAVDGTGLVLRKIVAGLAAQQDEDFLQGIFGLRGIDRGRLMCAAQGM